MAELLAWPRRGPRRLNLRFAHAPSRRGGGRGGRWCPAARMDIGASTGGRGSGRALAIEAVTGRDFGWRSRRRSVEELGEGLQLVAPVCRVGACSFDRAALSGNEVAHAPTGRRRLTRLAGPVASNTARRGRTGSTLNRLMDTPPVIGTLPDAAGSAAARGPVGIAGADAGAGWLPPAVGRPEMRRPVLKRGQPCRHRSGDDGEWEVIPVRGAHSGWCGQPGNNQRCVCGVSKGRLTG